MAAFLEETATSYLDFGATAASYTSSFVTGPQVFADGDKSTKIEYLTVYGNVVVDGSAYMRCRWDWADDSASGKWSTEQQVYTAARSDRDVSRKRLLVRGSGPALQLSFRSEAGKPFDLIGWSMMISADGVT